MYFLSRNICHHHHKVGYFSTTSLFNYRLSQRKSCQYFSNRPTTIGIRNITTANFPLHNNHPNNNLCYSCSINHLGHISNSRLLQIRNFNQLAGIKKRVFSNLISSDFGNKNKKKGTRNFSSFRSIFLILTSAYIAVTATDALINTTMPSSRTPENDSVINETSKFPLVLFNLNTVFRSFFVYAEHSKYNKDNKSGHEINHSTRKFTVEQVAKHDSLEKGVWVIHGDGVYDITQFISQHPGGAEKIMMAAGKSIDTFWSVYTVHHKQDVYDILSKFRIGDIILDTLDDLDDVDMEDPFSGDPLRPEWFIVHSDRPFNAEPTPEDLWTNGHITNNDTFYIRNHFPVPNLMEMNHKLSVFIDSNDHGLPSPGFVNDSDRNPKKINQNQGTKKPTGKTYSIHELKSKFPVHHVKATLQCAGNRRADMSKQKQTQGLQWGVTAISNAEWTGVYLFDILKDAGYNSISHSTMRHVIFKGAEGYEASIPLEKAVDPFGDVLIAFEMNGEPIPRDHGFPIRVIVPGHVAARSVKWVEQISLSAEEAKSVWQRKDYKVVPPWTTPDQLQEAYLRAVSIQDMPIQSAFLYGTFGTDRFSSRKNLVLFEQDGKDIQREEKSNNWIGHPNLSFNQLKNDGTVTLGGYAFSGGGRGVARVDVSINGGQTWEQARIKLNNENNDNHCLGDDEFNKPLDRFGRKWDWTLWEIEIKVPENKTSLDLVCRAVDTSNNVQPEHHAYNIRGLLANGWHRLNVDILHK